MDSTSIEWVTFFVFFCLEGHFEWLIMPFGLKNDLAIFQRKMDLILKKYKKFVRVYIEDILVFSCTHENHYDHLSIMFLEFIKNIIFIFKKKMELSKDYIDFLGMKIGNGKIKLQKHILKKIIDFPISPKYGSNKCFHGSTT